MVNPPDPSITAGVYAVADTSWTEGNETGSLLLPGNGITWNTQPAIGTAIPGDTATVSSKNAQLESFNITSYIQAQRQLGNEVVSLAIESQTSITSTKAGAGIVEFDSKESGVAPALVIDNTPPAPPTATLTAANITTSGAAETVVAEYSGPAAIDLNSIVGGPSGNLTITGPEATPIGAVSVNSTNPDDVFATYTINPPTNAGWTIADNGAYTVALKPNAVEDANDNFAAAASTSFKVGVSDTIPPVVQSVSAPSVTSAGNGTLTITVVYSDNVAINVSSIAVADISVSGPVALKVTGVTINPTTNSNLVTATYTVATTSKKPWAFANNGTYAISVKAGSVTDTSGNPIVAATGSFTVALPPPDTIPPTDTINPASTVTTSGAGNETIVVVYTDNVAVMPAPSDSPTSASAGPRRC